MHLYVNFRRRVFNQHVCEILLAYFVKEAVLLESVNLVLNPYRAGAELVGYLTDAARLVIRRPGDILREL